MAADNGKRSSNPFDVQTIGELVALMSGHDLSEIDLRDGERRIRLRRGASEQVVVAATPSVALPHAAAPSSAPLAPASPPSAATPEPAKSARHLHEIKAPTPGTFYASPSPDAEPFVKVGSRVSPDTVVCVLEAMKIFTEIQAECSGVIREVCVENQQAVEWGQVLFRVDPAG